MLKLVAIAALILSTSAFLFEDHALIWLVLAVLPGAIAVLIGRPPAERVAAGETVPPARPALPWLEPNRLPRTADARG